MGEQLRLPPAAMRKHDMCEKCKSIDERIQRYRLLSAGIRDQQTLDALERMIQELEAQKKALHPEE